MKIRMKYPGDHYENCNEISQAFIWKSEWNILGIIMKIVMKYPEDYYEMVMKYPRHSYENQNEISWGSYEDRNEISWRSLWKYTIKINEIVREWEWNPPVPMTYEKDREINEWKSQATRMRYLIKPLSIIHNGLQAVAWFLS